MRRVLVLRPEPGASATLRRARQRGLDAVAVPLFEVEPIAWTAPAADSFDGLLLTSANAIRHGGGGLQVLRALPVYAVGDATAAAARKAGFTIAVTGNASVETLLASIDPQLKLLHLAGRDRKIPADPAREIRTLTVYESRPRPAVDLRCAEGAVALVHSPRAGRRFAELVDRFNMRRASIAITAISGEAAEAAGHGWRSIEAADAPTDDTLLALAERLCNNTPAK